MAGHAAVCRWRPRARDGDIADVFLAGKMVDWLTGNTWSSGKEIARSGVVLRRLRAQVSRLVREHWKTIRTVARKLHRSRRLTGAQVREIVGRFPAS